jgi:hypothetical protein
MARPKLVTWPATAAPEEVADAAELAADEADLEAEEAAEEADLEAEDAAEDAERDMLEVTDDPEEEAEEAAEDMLELALLAAEEAAAAEDVRLDETEEAEEAAAEEADEETEDREEEETEDCEAEVWEADDCETEDWEAEDAAADAAATRGKRLVITSLGKGKLREIHKLTASKNGRSRLDNSGRSTASSRGALTVAVGTDGAAAAGAGTVVASRADLTFLTTAEVGSGVVASRTANRLSVGADGTSWLTSENSRSRVESHGGGGRSQNEDSGESHNCDWSCCLWSGKIGLNWSDWRYRREKEREERETGTRRRSK